MFCFQLFGLRRLFISNFHPTISLHKKVKIKVMWCKSISCETHKMMMIRFNFLFVTGIKLYIVKLRVTLASFCSGNAVFMVKLGDNRGIFVLFERFLMGNFCNSNWRFAGKLLSFRIREAFPYFLPPPYPKNIWNNWNFKTIFYNNYAFKTLKCVL